MIKQGMRQKMFAHVHTQRIIVNTVNKKDFQQEFGATKDKYLHRFATYQAANRYLDGRSYAQVLSCSPCPDIKRCQTGTLMTGHDTLVCYRSLKRSTEGSEVKMSTSSRPGCTSTTQVIRKWFG